MRQISEQDAKSIIKKIFISLVFIEILMILADVFLNHYQWLDSRPLRRSFNVTREDSIQNWFSTMQTMLVSLSLFAIYYLNKLGIHHKVSKLTQYGWLLFALVFMYLSMDDGSRLHERMGTALEDAFEGAASSGSGFISNFPSYEWQIIFVPILGIMGLSLLYFLYKNLLNQKRLFLVLAALMLLSFAVGLDFIEGLDKIANPQLHFLKLVEEIMEMFSFTLLLMVFLYEISDYFYTQEKAT